MGRHKDPLFIVTEAKRIKEISEEITDILDNSSLYYYEKLGLLEVIKSNLRSK